MAEFVHKTIVEIMEKNKPHLTWANNKLVLFAAGTGKGKTHFIVSMMAKDFPDKKILYLVNRKRLADEVNIRIDGLEAENITLLTYQHIENDAMAEVHLDEYDFIVCDECHYFISDSVFNDKTFYSFDVIMKARGCKVFMTATPQVVFSLLADGKESIERISDGRDYFINYEGYDYEEIKYVSPELRLYQACPGKHLNTSELLRTEYQIEDFLFYSVIPPLENNIEKLIIYSSDGELERYLADISGDAKIMIFMSRITGSEKRKGLVEWADYLSTKGRAVSIAFSEQTENRNSRAYKSEAKETQEKLIKNKKFETDVLLTTTVLDNGIDIIDDSLKYIICDLAEVNTVILEQCIGRKRLQSGEKIIVYVRAKEEDAARRRAEYTKIKKEHDRLLQMPYSPHEIIYFNRDYLNKCTRLEWTKDGLTILSDPLKMAYWEYENHCCKQDYAYLLKKNLRLFWETIDYPANKKKIQEEQEQHAQLVAFLNEMCGKIFTDEDKTKLQGLTGKKHVSKINIAIKEKKLAYEVEVKKTNRKNLWVLKHI